MEARGNFVIVPFDYDDLPQLERSSIVPICMQRKDRYGRLIAWGWFSDGVAPAASYIRATAKRMGDEHLASELAESSVHSLWYRHNERLGPFPKRAVMKEARYRALDMMAGGQRWMRDRTHKLVPLLRQMEEALPDPANFSERYALEHDLTVLSERLTAKGLHDVSMMLDMVRDYRSWEEIALHFDSKPNTLQKKFRRWVRRLYP